MMNHYRYGLVGLLLLLAFVVVSCKNRAPRVPDVDVLIAKRHPDTIPLSNKDRRLVGRALCDIQGQLSSVYQFIKDDPGAKDMQDGLARGFHEILVVIDSIDPIFAEDGEAQH